MKAGLAAVLCAVSVALAACYQDRSQAQGLLPFFDALDNPSPIDFPHGQKIDITPPPPKLTGFDQAVLDVCGPWSERVNAKRFRRLFIDYPQVLEGIKQRVGGEIKPGRRGSAQFLDDLTALWFNRRGFQHIFCGEPRGTHKIGGLHFHGRYLQLQNEGLAGRLPNNAKNEEVLPGAVYTLGVKLKLDGGWIQDPLKGYGYLSNAEEILGEATLAFKSQGNREGACIFKVRDSETGKFYPSVFVRQERAIVTFYPDATPRGKACRR